MNTQIALKIVPYLIPYVPKFIEGSWYLLVCGIVYTFPLQSMLTAYLFYFSRR